MSVARVAATTTPTNATTPIELIFLRPCDLQLLPGAGQAEGSRMSVEIHAATKDRWSSPQR